MGSSVNAWGKSWGLAWGPSWGDVLITPGGLKVWLGTWETKTLKVWDGTTWNVKTVKRWSGSDWVLIQ